MVEREAFHRFHGMCLPCGRVVWCLGVQCLGRACIYIFYERTVAIELSRERTVAIELIIVKYELL